MGTKIIQFGTVPDGILAAFAASGYQVSACGTSIPKLKQALQQPENLDAIAVTENDASSAVGILAPVRSFHKVPLILFQNENQTCDPSDFDLVIPEHAPLSDLLQRVEALIERSRAIRAQTEILAERFHSLLREASSLREQSVMAREQSVTARVASQRIRAKLQRSESERINIPCVLVVDDHARWRGMTCSMLEEYVDCGMICQAENGIEAVQRATELKPQLILLDLNLPGLNGIQAAGRIGLFSPDSAILFVSMNNSEDVVSAALGTGAKGYVFKPDAGKELWPAIQTVLQNRRYLSRGLRGLHSAAIN